MPTIVAIGGGEIWRVKVLEDGSVIEYPMEILSIDQEIINLSKVNNPKLLFLPTPKNDRLSYCEAVENYYQGHLGCEVSHLKLIEENLSKNEIEDKINAADIIYVSGGDTRLAIQTWQEQGVDVLLKQAHERGTILSGISAGAICWFDWYDNYDYVDEPNWKPDLLAGLGLIKGLAVPHYEELEPSEQLAINALVNERKIESWAIDNCAAVVFEDGNIRTISARDDRGVTKLCNQDVNKPTLSFPT